MSSTSVGAAPPVYLSRVAHWRPPKISAVPLVMNRTSNIQAKKHLISLRPVRLSTILKLSAHERTAQAESAPLQFESGSPEINSPTNSTGHERNGVGIVEGQVSASSVKSSLRNYRIAVEDANESGITEIEAYLLSLEDEKNSLAERVLTLSRELSVEKDRVLRISADFDNIRKRTEKEKLSLVENVQGDVVGSLLPVLDSFERAKSQIRTETEGEEKINASYQSIYRQLMEILTSLGVKVIETIGHPFDPLFHEAIMREDSTKYGEGIVLEEFRKGFKLQENLLRPSMVKVSAGPGSISVSPDDACSEDDARRSNKACIDNHE